MWSKLMELLIHPSNASMNKAKSMIKIMDKTQNFASTKAPLVSKLAKNIKTVKIPVARFFDSPAQVSSYFAEGEYDLVAIFKMLDYEAYFSKAVQKKIGLFSKSGFAIHCNNDEIKQYLDGRFKLMELQTGISLQQLIKKLSKYCIIGSNAFVIKVRDKNFDNASTYKLDGKDQQPVVGYFLAHPTTMKPRFKYVKDPDTGLPKLELDKWIHINRRGVLKGFELEDVCHFVLQKQDGLVFGTPEIIPAIDDIKVLRKIEEDCQLLMYRDLFPIIHYKVEKPTILDHMGGMDELTQARNDMQNIIQDGGIATDSRHEIEFIGSEGKGLDVVPLLEYFQQRVFSGLGVSPSDMGMSADTNKNSAENASEQVIDYVKDIQQDIAEQFKRMILTELMLQSPFSMEEIMESENEVTLKFEEVDIEWKVRTENHQADLFGKGVKTIDEVRNHMGMDTFTDQHLERTHHGLYEKPMQEAELDLQHKQVEVGAAKTVKQIQHKASAARKKPSEKRSAADRDSIKAAGTNSNIVKHKDSLMLEDAITIQEQFKNLYETVKDKSIAQKKITLMLGTKVLYDNIKEEMAGRVKEGAIAAAKDLGIELNGINIEHNIFEPLDRLRDSVIDMVCKDESTINRAAVRISTANRTEQSRGYNYGYSLTCLNNKVNTVTVIGGLDDISEESMKHVGTEIKLSNRELMTQIPPFHPNSKLKIKAKVDTE